MKNIDEKIKKIVALIDGAATEGEARAASLALQRPSLRTTQSWRTSIWTIHRQKSARRFAISAVEFPSGRKPLLSLLQRTTGAGLTRHIATMEGLSFFVGEGEIPLSPRAALGRAPMRPRTASGPIARG